MKLLESSVLEALSSRVSNAAIDCILDVKFEPYSCKMIKDDKKQWKNIDNYSDRQPLSPPDSFLCISASPIGHSARMRHLSSCSGSDIDVDNDGKPVLVDSISLRTLFDLRRVLNCAYPDYDFTNVKSESFSLIPNMDDVVEIVDNRFMNTVNDYMRIKDELWDAIENEIDPMQCKIYGYKADYEGDPFSEDGCMWAINYIFYNKVLKRILLLSCRGLSQNRHNSSYDALFELETEEDY